MALRHPETLAGVVALSCFLVDDDSLDEEMSDANRGIRIFQAHGTDDPLVPLERGLEARDRLMDLGCDVEWKTYPMPHAVCAEEIRDIGEWLTEVLRATG